MDERSNRDLKDALARGQFSPRKTAFAREPSMHGDVLTFQTEEGVSHLLSRDGKRLFADTPWRQALTCGPKLGGYQGQ